MRLMFYISSAGDKFDFAVDLFSGLYGYSHVELQFSDGMSFSSSPRDGGCRFKNIVYDPNHWVAFELPYGTPEWERQIRSDCSLYEGKKYDWLGILFTFLIPMGIEDGQKWWCSEICGKLIRSQNYKISPNQLAKRFGLPRQRLYLPHMSLQWQG